MVWRSLALLLLLCVPWCALAQDRVPDQTEDVYRFADVQNAVIQPLRWAVEAGGSGVWLNEASEAWVTLIAGGELESRWAIDHEWALHEQLRLRVVIPAGDETEAQLQIEGDQRVEISRTLQSFGGLAMGSRFSHHLRVVSSRLGALRDHTIGPSPHVENTLAAELLPNLAPDDWDTFAWTLPMRYALRRVDYIGGSTRPLDVMTSHDISLSFGGRFDLRSDDSRLIGDFEIFRVRYVRSDFEYRPMCHPTHLGCLPIGDEIVFDPPRGNILKDPRYKLEEVDPALRPLPSRGGAVDQIGVQFMRFVYLLLEGPDWRFDLAGHLGLSFLYDQELGREGVGGDMGLLLASHHPAFDLSAGMLWNAGPSADNRRLIDAMVLDLVLAVHPEQSPVWLRSHGALSWLRDLELDLDGPFRTDPEIYRVSVESEVVVPLGEHLEVAAYHLFDVGVGPGPEWDYWRAAGAWYHEGGALLRWRSAPREDR